MRPSRPLVRLLAGALLVALVAQSCSPKKYQTSRKASTPRTSTGAAAAADDVQTSAVPGKRKPRRAASGVPPAALAGADSTKGVTREFIDVVYYWKGDETRSSTFLQGTGAEANVDEGEAFKTWVEYINKYAGGGGDIMGWKFDLHGRRLRPTVLEVGRNPEDAAVTAEKIVADIKPFAAIAAHGSLSAYTCKILSAAGIFGLSTYNVDFGLYHRSNGYCLPSAASFEAQVDASVGYLATRVTPTPYQTTTGTEPRKFGVVYAEYQGLVDSMPGVIARMKAAGVPIVEKRTVSTSLPMASQQAPTIVGDFAKAGVNTVIIPDGGAPLSFTPAAEAQNYHPDYYVWPCSGQDFTAMVRLLDPAQWARASGLTCYDREFLADLVPDDSTRAREWFRKYTSMGHGDPPAQAPLIYGALLPLVVGITGAGQSLTPRSFTAGLDAFPGYRYDASAGRTDRAESMWLVLDRIERPLLGDFTVLTWSATSHRSGSPFAGDYTFPENGRRYLRDGFR